MAEIALSLPFSLNAYGGIAVATEQSKIWADRVRSVLGTTRRERVMHPEIGTLIPFALFNTETSAESQVETEIGKAFSSQLNLLRLDDVVITHDEFTNTMTVEVIYALPNNEVVSTVVGLALVNGANPIYEESL
jgi:phage baseplate assembly protein W